MYIILFQLFVVSNKMKFNSSTSSICSGVRVIRWQLGI